MSGIWEIPVGRGRRFGSALPPLLNHSGVRGDGQSRWDFSAIKNFPIRDRVIVQLRAEVYNAWNHTNFANPNTDPTSTTFGRITGTTADARNWQFALKLTF